MLALQTTSRRPSTKFLRNEGPSLHSQNVSLTGSFQTHPGKPYASSKRNGEASSQAIASLSAQLRRWIDAPASRERRVDRAFERDSRTGPGPQLGQAVVSRVGGSYPACPRAGPRWPRKRASCTGLAGPSIASEAVGSAHIGRYPPSPGAENSSGLLSRPRSSFPRQPCSPEQRWSTQRIRQRSPESSLEASTASAAVRCAIGFVSTA